MNNRWKTSLIGLKDEVKQADLEGQDEIVVLTIVLAGLDKAIKEESFSPNEFDYWFGGFFSRSRYTKQLTPELYNEICRIMIAGNATDYNLISLAGAVPPFASRPPFQVFADVDTYLITTNQLERLPQLYRTMTRRFPAETAKLKGLDPNLPLEWLVEIL